MIVLLSPIPANFQGNNEEFEDICVIYRIIDSVTKEVSEIFQHWMDDSEEIRIGYKSNFHVKSSLIARGIIACWVMTMPFGAFYFVQHLGSVQIPMN
ncbi:8544_t:CDS:2 [Ambispora leptoticha]|uniref:8544_t:CDS:1 n=1 Tax=Ambispora leptoticha TaxID=144679 RepID=A0A9N9BFD5_9GLOM|nr:8544_t:CDS:2 [Ambispora leptoticha]